MVMRKAAASWTSLGYGLGSEIWYRDHLLDDEANWEFGERD